MLGKDRRINRPHTLLGGVAQKDGIQATNNRNGNRSLRLGTVYTRSVIAPLGGRSVRIDEGKLEQSITIKGFAIDSYLSRVIQDGRDCLHRDY